MPRSGSSIAAEGVEHGTNLFSQLMSQRRQLDQQWQEHLHNLELKRSQEQRAQELFPIELQQMLHNMQLQHQQEQRAQEESPVNMAYKNAMIQNFMHKNGPNPYKEEKQKLDLDLVKAKIDELRRNPTQKETPEERRAAELELHKQKRQVTQGEPGKLTTPVISGIQKSIVAIDTILPLLRDLEKEKIPSAIFGGLTPGQKNLVESMQNLGIDELSSIFNLPKDKLTTQKLEQMVSRQRFESERDYKKRLAGLIKRIEHKRHLNTQTLKEGKVNLEDTQNNEEMVTVRNKNTGETKQITKKQYAEMTGKPHE